MKQNGRSKHSQVDHYGCKEGRALSLEFLLDLQILLLLPESCLEGPVSGMICRLARRSFQLTELVRTHGAPLKY
jgi:hypothetical protein